jgi:hypothetical protein
MVASAGALELDEDPEGGLSIFVPAEDSEDAVSDPRDVDSALDDGTSTRRTLRGGESDLWHAGIEVTSSADRCADEEELDEGIASSTAWGIQLAD